MSLLADIPSVDCTVGDLAVFHEAAPSLADPFDGIVSQTVDEELPGTGLNATEVREERNRRASNSFLVQEEAPLVSRGSGTAAATTGFFKKSASSPPRLRVCAELPSGSAVHAARATIRATTQVTGGELPDPDTERSRGFTGHRSRLAAEYELLHQGVASSLGRRGTMPTFFEPGDLPPSSNSSSRDETPVSILRERDDGVGIGLLRGTSVSSHLAAVQVGASPLDALLHEGASVLAAEQPYRRCVDQETRRRRNLVLRELEEIQRIRGNEREALHRAESERYRQEQLRVEANLDDVTDVYVSPEAKRAQRQRREAHCAHCAAWKQTYRADIRCSIRSKQARVEAACIPRECFRMEQEDRYSAAAESVRAAAAQLMRTFWETSLETRVSTARSLDKLLATSGLRNRKADAVAAPSDDKRLSDSVGNDDDVADEADDCALMPPEASVLRILWAVGAVGTHCGAASRPASSVPPIITTANSSRLPLKSSSRPSSGSSSSSAVPTSCCRRVPGVAGPAASRPLSAVSHASGAECDPLDVLERDIATLVALRAPTTIAPLSGTATPVTAAAASTRSLAPQPTSVSPAPSSRTSAMSRRLRPDSLFESFLFGCMALYEGLDKDIRDLQSSADAVLASFRMQLDSLAFQESQIREDIVPAEALAFRFLKRDELVSRDQAKMQERINVKNRKKTEDQEASRRLALVDAEYFDVLLHDIVCRFAESERRSMVETAEGTVRESLVARGTRDRSRVRSVESFHAQQYRLWKSEGQRRTALEWDEGDARNDLYRSAPTGHEPLLSAATL